MASRCAGAGRALVVATCAPWRPPRFLASRAPQPRRAAPVVAAAALRGSTDQARRLPTPRAPSCAPPCTASPPLWAAGRGGPQPRDAHAAHAAVRAASPALPSCVARRWARDGAHLLHRIVAPPRPWCPRIARGRGARLTRPRAPRCRPRPRASAAATRPFLPRGPRARTLRRQRAPCAPWCRPRAGVPPGTASQSRASRRPRGRSSQRQSPRLYRSCAHRAASSLLAARARRGATRRCVRAASQTFPACSCKTNCQWPALWLRGC